MVANFDAIAGEADDAFDEVLTTFFGAVEDDEVADVGLVGAEGGFEDEEPIADLEGRDHRFAGDDEGFDDGIEDDRDTAEGEATDQEDEGEGLTVRSGAESVAGDQGQADGREKEWGPAAGEEPEETGGEEPGEGGAVFLLVEVAEAGPALAEEDGVPGVFGDRVLDAGSVGAVAAEGVEEVDDPKEDADAEGSGAEADVAGGAEEGPKDDREEEGHADCPG